MKILIFLSLLGSYFFTYANEEIFDEKIERFCKSHELSNIETSKKCMWVLKAQMRFETWYLEKVSNNNLFNFRSPAIKKIWTEKYWVIELNNLYLVFSDKTKSIEFAVNRFFIFDVNDDIKKIVDDFCDATPKVKENYIYLINDFIWKEKEIQENYGN